MDVASQAILKVPTIRIDVNKPGCTSRLTKQVDIDRQTSLEGPTSQRYEASQAIAEIPKSRAGDGQVCNVITTLP